MLLPMRMDGSSPEANSSYTLLTYTGALAESGTHRRTDRERRADEVNDTSREFVPARTHAG